MDLLCPLPLEDQPFLPRLHAALVKEAYQRSRVTLAPLVLVLLLLKFTLLDPRLNWVFLALAVIIAGRGLLQAALDRRPDWLPSIRGRHFVFIAGAALTGLGFMALNIIAFPILPPFPLAIMWVSEEGVSATAMVSMSSSPAAFLLYMFPMIGSIAIMALLSPPPGLPWSFAFITIFFLATQVLVSQVIHRTLRDNFLMQLKLEDGALGDALTGLRNRRYLHEFIEVELGRLLRTWHPDSIAKGIPSRSLAFIMLDLDHFKFVNDTFGHASGDVVLVQVAQLLKEVTRDPDLVVRWGGEEFLILALDVPRSTPVLVERIRKAVENHPFQLPSGEILQRTCSLGYAHYPFMPQHPDQLGWEQVLHLADFALYRAKQEGRNRAVGATPGETSPELILEALKTGDKGLQSTVASGGLRLT